MSDRKRGGEWVRLRRWGGEDGGACACDSVSVYSTRGRAGGGGGASMQACRR